MLKLTSFAKISNYISKSYFITIIEMILQSLMYSIGRRFRTLRHAQSSVLRGVEWGCVRWAELVWMAVVRLWLECIGILLIRLVDGLSVV